MRCIEIRGAAERQDRHKSINRNMRCIEIPKEDVTKEEAKERLIET